MAYESDKRWLNSHHNGRPEENETNMLKGWRRWGRRVEGGDWQLRILYSAKLSFKNQGERKYFWTPKDGIIYPLKPALQKMLK